MTELNNLAQSNYDRFISATSIPSREVSEVEVGNPYSIRTTIHITAAQTNPLYRTYLHHTWLTLDPGENKKVKIMFEYVGKRSSKEDQQDQDRKYIKLPNDVRFTSFIEDPSDSPRHALQTLGGAQIQVVTGKSSKFEKLNFNHDNNEVEGLISTREGVPVSGGKVILTYTFDDAQEKTRDQIIGKIFGGKFYATLRDKNWKTIRGYYVPAEGYADCYSEIIENIVE
jgi:hypothetical protein